LGDATAGSLIQQAEIPAGSLLVLVVGNRGDAVALVVSQSVFVRCRGLVVRR
jgi:hypothetical protein